MSFVGDKLDSWLRMPETRGEVDLDDPATTVLHGEIIRCKPFLQKVYVDFYRRLKYHLPMDDRKAVIVELGSGAGFIKELLPGTITSDVQTLPNIDLCFSALGMPFEEASVDAFVMLNVFHHIPDSRKFLLELSRALRADGKIVMIEPANTLFSRLIYQNFHHESFEPEGGWGFEGQGPLADANGAIPWIVLSRDRERFEREFPDLLISHMENHSPFRYLVSGGVSMRQLVPSWTHPLFCGFEWLLSPLHRFLGMFQTIKIEKKSTK